MKNNFYKNYVYAILKAFILKWVSYAEYRRFSRKHFVIVSSEKIDFHKPIPAASLIELIGRVEAIGNTSIKIKVDIYLEKMEEAFREKVVTGSFTLVAIDKDHRPIKIES